MTGVPIRVLVADDSAVVRKGLAALLAAEPDFRLVGTARNGREACARAAALQPDVILMDVAMPVMNGLAATRLIRLAHPLIRVVALSAHADEEYLRGMAAAGAAGFVSKQGCATSIAVAIRACVAARRGPGRRATWGGAKGGKGPPGGRPDPGSSFVVDLQSV